MVYYGTVRAVQVAGAMRYIPKSLKTQARTATKLRQKCIWFAQDVIALHASWRTCGSTENLFQLCVLTVTGNTAPRLTLTKKEVDFAQI